MEHSDDSLKQSQEEYDHFLTDSMTKNIYVDYAIIAVVLFIILTFIILMLWCCFKKCGKKQNENENENENENKIIIERVGTYKSEVEAESDIELKYNENAFESEFIKINIKTSDGTIKPLPILNTLTISMLKGLIAKHLNIPERKQELRYNHKRCDSALQIGHFGIKNGDIIELNELNDGEIDIDNQVKITLKPKYEDQATYTIYCSNLIKIREFRKEVFAKIPAIPIDQQLLYIEDTELMDEDALLQEYGIHHDCIIQFEWKKIDITIQ